MTSFSQKVTTTVFCRSACGRTLRWGNTFRLKWFLHGGAPSPKMIGNRPFFLHDFLDVCAPRPIQDFSSGRSS